MPSSLIAAVTKGPSTATLTDASVNFLSLGLQPPNSDWALMISENRQYISLNPWAVLAPAAMIALLTIGVNLTGDAIARSLGRSYVPKAMRNVPTT